MLYSTTLSRDRLIGLLWIIAHFLPYTGRPKDTYVCVHECMCGSVCSTVRTCQVHVAPDIRTSSETAFLWKKNPANKTATFHLNVIRVKYLNFFCGTTNYLTLLQSGCLFLPNEFFEPSLPYAMLTRNMLVLAVVIYVIYTYYCY